MLLPTLFSTVSLALTASAFLIPLEVADKATISPSTPIHHHGLKTINLDCTTCPVFPLDSANTASTAKYIPNDLVLEFSSDQKEISLNGVPIYPNTLKAMGMSIAAKQQLKKTEDNVELLGKALKSDVQLSYSMEVLADVPLEQATSMAIVIQIIGIEGVVVDVDSILLGVIRKSDGEIFLHTVKTGKPTLSPEAKQCTSILCRVRAIIATKLSAFKGAVSNKISAMKGCGRKGSNKGHQGSADRKDHGHRHSHNRHRHHSALRRVFYVVRRFFRQVFVPIFIGVAAGMAASAIGMLIVQIGLLLWMRFHRSRGAYEAVQQVEVVDDELPKYEDLDKKIVVNEKDEKEVQI